MVFCRRISYIQKDFFQFSKSLLKNKKEVKLIILNYQFTHEYKKLQYKDDYKSLFWRSFDNDQNINDESRFIEQENTIGLTSDLEQIWKN